MREMGKGKFLDEREIRNVWAVVDMWKIRYTFTYWEILAQRALFSYLRALWQMQIFWILKIWINKSQMNLQVKPKRTNATWKHTHAGHRWFIYLISWLARGIKNHRTCISILCWRITVPKVSLARIGCAMNLASNAHHG